MDKVILGKTGLEVSKNGFGALPIQRITKKEAVYLLQKAFYNGINYFDTARAYSDSEEKIGAAFEYTREKIIISSPLYCIVSGTVPFPAQYAGLFSPL